MDEMISNGPTKYLIDEIIYYINNKCEEMMKENLLHILEVYVNRVISTVLWGIWYTAMYK